MSNEANKSATQFSPSEIEIRHLNFLGWNGVRKPCVCLPPHLIETSEEMGTYLGDVYTWSPIQGCWYR